MPQIYFNEAILSVSVQPQFVLWAYDKELQKKKSNLRELKVFFEEKSSEEWIIGVDASIVRLASFEGLFLLLLGLQYGNTSTIVWRLRLSFIVEESTFSSASAAACNSRDSIEYVQCLKPHIAIPV